MTEVDSLDQIGPVWTELDRSGQNGRNRTNADGIGPKWKKWPE